MAQVYKNPEQMEKHAKKLLQEAVNLIGFARTHDALKAMEDEVHNDPKLPVDPGPKIFT